MTADPPDHGFDLRDEILRENWARHNAGDCPYCGGYNIDLRDEGHDPGEYWESYQCLDCNKKFIEVYAISSVERDQSDEQGQEDREGQQEVEPEAQEGAEATGEDPGPS